jgi:EPS-associated MarR family transcriptional regulator
MASRRKEYNEDIKFRVLQIVSNKSEMTSRELARAVEISNGSAYYMLISLIDKGFIKVANFKESSRNKKCSYLLTSKGIREKSLITSRYLLRKKLEYKLLEKEITELEQGER